MIEVVNVKFTKCDVYCGRGKNGKAHMLNTPIGKKGWLGNPFTVGYDGTREEVIDKFEVAFRNKMKEDTAFREAVLKLDGKLGCFCRPLSCHLDKIIKVRNEWVKNE